MLNVSNWTLRHPAKVKDLLEAQAKLEQLVHAPAPSNQGFLSAETLESALNEHTKHTLYSGQERQRAINLARNTIERELKAQVNANLDKYLEQVKQIFEPAAETYTEAVEKLPATMFTAEDVLGFSEEQREAYHTAREAAGVISWAADWLWALLDLPGQSLGGYSRWMLVAEPGSVAGLTVLQLEEDYAGEPAYGALLPPVLRALREGARLRVATPVQARAEAEELEAERQNMSQENWLNLRRDLKL
ncbi:hypothetical protein [Corynebacterium pseudogenitalium]|uniref:Uncharacterized protein n=1 Tax=Corynebacterium pseudogenitalium ATCC 33035 TaxID=525264 RepID=E2S5Q7_9CORY|nr:hypothetical protein [Corynebacterium pseudogenitalium]EFQ79918.1 hypothetical protein HMPREF0305_11798 [Corynebacterium pseudogenitalium ATCC 33035]